MDEARLSALEAAAAAAAGYEVVTWRDRRPDDRALLNRRMSTDAPSRDVPGEEH